MISFYLIHDIFSHFINEKPCCIKCNQNIHIKNINIDSIHEKCGHISIDCEFCGHEMNCTVNIKSMKPYEKDQTPVQMEDFENIMNEIKSSNGWLKIFS